MGGEVAIRWFNATQKQWFCELLPAVYGTLKHARYMDRGSKSNRNGFNLFCQHMGTSIVEAPPYWRRFGVARKEQFLELGHQMNRDLKENRVKCDYLPKLYKDKRGPLCSRDRRLPICGDEANRILFEPNSELVDRWGGGKSDPIYSDNGHP